MQICSDFLDTDLWFRYIYLENLQHIYKYFQIRFRSSSLFSALLGDNTKNIYKIQAFFRRLSQESRHSNLRLLQILT